MTKQKGKQETMFAALIEVSAASSKPPGVFFAKEALITIDGVTMPLEEATADDFQKQPLDYAALEKKIIASMAIPPEFLASPVVPVPLTAEMLKASKESVLEGSAKKPVVFDLETIPGVGPGAFVDYVQDLQKPPLSAEQVAEFKAAWKEMLTGLGAGEWFAPAKKIPTTPTEYAIEQTVNAKVKQKLKELEQKLFVVDLGAMSSAERTEFLATWGKFQALPPLFEAVPIPEAPPSSALEKTCPDCGIGIASIMLGYFPEKHANVCKKWKCFVCSTKFATLPEPQKKLFGAKPVCAACLQKAPHLKSTIVKAGTTPAYYDDPDGKHDAHGPVDAFSYYGGPGHNKPED